MREDKVGQTIHHGLYQRRPPDEPDEPARVRGVRRVFQPRRIAQTYGNLVPAVATTALGGCWSVLLAA
jgi:hypothetical protein